MFLDIWANHLKDEKEKGDFQVSVLKAREVLDRLKDLLGSFENDMERVDMSPAAFDTPNWAYKQAFSNGYRACLNDVNKLITLDQKKDK